MGVFDNVLLGVTDTANSATLNSDSGGSVDFPTDIYPFSTSQSSSSQRANSYSGLPANYRTQLLNSVMPTLNNAVTNYTENIDNYLQSGMNSYNMQLQNALKEILPKIIGNYGRRGILDSSVASDTLGAASRGVITDATTKGYDTAMLSAQLKTALPEVLASIAQLGSSSTSSSSGTQSSTTYQEDRTVMFRAMADLLQSA